MYVVVYYIVFAMGNESTIVNSKKIQILYYCLSLQCMIQQTIWFDHQEVRPTYTDINMDIVKSRKYQGVFEVKSRVKTWQVRGIWSQQLEH